jgi:hypothetical protein
MIPAGTGFSSASDEATGGDGNSGTAGGPLHQLDDAHDAYASGVRSLGAKSDLTST